MSSSTSRAIRAVLIGACLGLPAEAAALTFVVDSTADAADVAPGNGACAAAGGSCTLRAAVQEADALTAGEHTITLPPGTYTLTLGALRVTNAITRLIVNGAGATTTTVRNSTLTPVFVHDNGRLELRDLTITNGPPCALVWSGEFRLTRTTVTSCRGRGIQAAPDQFGFGSVTLDITDSVISNNLSSSGDGGGLYLANAVTTTITRSTITANSAARHGGGVYVVDLGSSPPGTLTMAQSRIEKNTAGLSGGGMLVSGLVVVTVADSAISGNAAPAGGGVHAANLGYQMPGSFLLTRSTVAQNVATGGGGGGLLIASTYDEPGLERRVRLSNSTISGNQAPAGTGGALTIADTGSALLTNVTVAQNASATGGAIAVQSGELHLGNSIVADNGAVNCVLTGALIDRGNNLEFPGTSCGLTLPGDVRADPQLAPLGDYGGPTTTHALRRSSPAVDAADAATCAASPVSGVDQRGFQRPPLCDIGSFEFGVPGSPFTDPMLTAGATVIRAVHLTELRDRIDAQRVRFGLAPFSWSDPTLAGVLVQALHVQQLREAIAAAHVAAAVAGVRVTPPMFSDDPLAAGQPIEVEHVSELRIAVTSLETR
jgi:CSLREA domain-containing protein